MTAFKLVYLFGAICCLLLAIATAILLMRVA